MYSAGVGARPLKPPRLSESENVGKKSFKLSCPGKGGQANLAR